MCVKCCKVSLETNSSKLFFSCLTLKSKGEEGWPENFWRLIREAAERLVSWWSSEPSGSEASRPALRRSGWRTSSARPPGSCEMDRWPTFSARSNSREWKTARTGTFRPEGSRQRCSSASAPKSIPASDVEARACAESCHQPFPSQLELCRLRPGGRRLMKRRFGWTNSDWRTSRGLEGHPRSSLLEAYSQIWTHRSKFWLVPATASLGLKPGQRTAAKSLGAASTWPEVAGASLSFRISKSCGRNRHSGTPLGGRKASDLKTNSL